MVDTISPSASELVFETAVVRLAAQSADVNALDGKVGIAIAADGVLAGFMFGARSVPGEAWAVIATAALLVLSAVAALLALWPRRYAIAPDVRALATMAASNHAESAASIKWRFVRNLVEAVETNQLLLHRKIRWLKVSTTALFATIMLLGLNATVEAIR